MTTAIWRIRRDRRLSDNQALMAALAEGGSVIPVFILDPVLLRHLMLAPNGWLCG
jgi:deoxyribodipyrimidine photolyase